MTTHLSPRSLGSGLALDAALTAGSMASAQPPNPPLVIDTARITIAGPHAGRLSVRGDEVARERGAIPVTPEEEGL